MTIPWNYIKTCLFTESAESVISVLYQQKNTFPMYNLSKRESIIKCVATKTNKLVAVRNQFIFLIRNNFAFLLLCLIQ